MNKKINLLIKKGIIGLLAFVFVFAMMPAPNAQAVIKGYTIPKMDKVPTIDGVFHADEWGEKIFTLTEGAENIRVLEEGGTGVLPAPITADIYLGYDANSIYICAVATYDDHKNEVLLPSDLWQGDCMQIQISSTVGTDRNEIGFAFNSITNKPMTVAWASTGSFALESGKDYYVVRDGNVTIYEVALPVSAFSTTVTELTDGMMLPFSLSFHMNAGGFYEYADGIVQNKDINLGAIFGLGVEPDVNAVAVTEQEEVVTDEQQTPETKEEPVATQTPEPTETPEATPEATPEVTQEPAVEKDSTEAIADNDTSVKDGVNMGAIIAIIAAVVLIGAVVVVVLKKKQTK